jgi:hypothetical protein
MEEAGPQQRRRLEPPFLDLSPYSTLAGGAVRQLDGTGASGPRRPPAGAARLRHAERPGSWLVPEGTAFRVRVVARAAGPGGLLAELLGVATGPVMPPLPCRRSPPAPCSRPSWSPPAPDASPPGPGQPSRYEPSSRQRLGRMPMTDDHFVSSWRLQAPIEQTWDEVVHTERWPSWWKYVGAVASGRCSTC